MFRLEKSRQLFQTFYTFVRVGDAPSCPHEVQGLRLLLFGQFGDDVPHLVIAAPLASVDPGLVLYGVDPYSKILSGDFQQENMIATLTTLFGGLRLVLSAVGLYGVMAYSVEQRRGEIGVRMALGADRGRVVKMVLRTAFSQIGIGLALGIPSAIAVGRLMTDQLFGVKPWDPGVMAFAIMLLCTAALLASLIPASRAAGVEPMAALRNQ